MNTTPPALVESPARRMTCATVNAECRRRGYAERLTRGLSRGFPYYYWRGGDAPRWVDTIVPVSEITALSLTAWLEDLEARRAAHKDHWPETEAVIRTDPYRAYYYACDIIKGRWPEGEAVIQTDPYTAYLYARDVIKGRWLEAESVIQTDPSSAYLYARSVIHGRWLEGEAVIQTNPNWAYAYARDVIKGRWPEKGDVR